MVNESCETRTRDKRRHRRVSTSLSPHVYLLRCAFARVTEDNAPWRKLVKLVPPDTYAIAKGQTAVERIMLVFPDISNLQVAFVIFILNTASQYFWAEKWIWILSGGVNSGGIIWGSRDKKALMNFGVFVLQEARISVALYTSKTYLLSAVQTPKIPIKHIGFM